MKEKFIEDALEISNHIEIYGGDSAKESCGMYKAALRGGDHPEYLGWVVLERILDQKPRV